MSWVIYLHPTKKNPAWDQLSSYFKHVRAEAINKKLGPNQALNYPFHISLTSFFDSSSEAEIESILDAINEGGNGLKIDEVGYVTKDNMIVVGIKSDSINNFIESLQEQFPELIESPSKENLHLTLAYQFSPKDYQKIIQIIKQHIDLTTWDPREWTVKLWYYDPRSATWDLMRN